MEPLFKEFESSDKAAWKAKLEKDLKGITFDQLVSMDDSGLPIVPFYTAEDIQEPSVPKFTHRDWHIATEIVVTDEKQANAEALKLLNEGASALVFSCGKTSWNWDLLFSEIGLDHILLVVKFTDGAPEAKESVRQWISAKHQSCIVLADPFASYDPEKLSSISEAVADDNTIAIDTNLLFNAGANSVTQIAVALAQMHEYLNAGLESKQSHHFRQVFISVSVGTLFFEEIAKLRALRAALHLLFEEYSLSPELLLFVNSGQRQLAPFDVDSNLLRNAIAGMAAVLGGANALCLTPFDQGAAQQKNPAFAARMGINTQLILKEESFFDSLADVAQGSFSIEHRTSDIAKAAWTLFQEVEQQGGLQAALANGWIKTTVETQAQQLISDYQSGKKSWIGINKYTQKNEVLQTIERSTPASSKGLNPLILSNEILNN